MHGLSSILSLFRNELNTFNKTGAKLLDSKFYMTLEVLKIAFLAGKHKYCVIMYATLLWMSLHSVTKYVNH